MVRTIVSPSAIAEVDPDREAHVKAFRWMVLARLLDDRFASLYRAGKIHGGVFLGRGQEALSVAIGMALRKGDIFAPLIRDTAGRLAFGESILDAVRTFLGSPLGPMRARDGNVHRGRPKEGILPMLSHLGAMISVVNGVLLARRLKNMPGSIGAASIGDGATSTGAFHEGLNQAAVEKLPLVLVVANNQYAYSTPNDRQFACHSLVDKAVGYGVTGHSVDGTNLSACLKGVGEAARRAREGLGPQLVVASLLRLCGHGEHDDAHYVDPQLRQSALGMDCLKVAEDNLLRQAWMEKKELEEWKNEAALKVEEAVATVQHDPAPNPYREEWRSLSSKQLAEGHDEQ